jgi:hypothetical protein
MPDSDPLQPSSSPAQLVQDTRRLSSSNAVKTVAPHFGGLVVQDFQVPASATCMSSNMHALGSTTPAWAFPSAI